jgi:long-chain acyl-CoA synthetase
MIGSKARDTLRYVAHRGRRAEISISTFRATRSLRSAGTDGDGEQPLGESWRTFVERVRDHAAGIHPARVHLGAPKNRARGNPGSARPAVTGPEQPTAPEPTIELLHIGVHARATPDKVAAIEAATGRARTYAELEDRSARLAHVLVGCGIEPGGHVAAMLVNQLEYFDVAWASQRSGFWLTPVNWHLTAAEAGYIVTDCQAQALITTPTLAPTVAAAVAELAAPALRFVTDDARQVGESDFEPLEDAIASASIDARRPEVEGAFMFYSSGTTGRPKGIVPGWAPVPYGMGQGIDGLMRLVYGFSADSIYLCPAPLYHAAPLGWSMGTQRLGGTVVVMDRFEPVELLRLVEEFKVTHVQVVPTMFVRLLKLDASDRNRFDLSSLRCVIHAAAPCPVDVKAQMLDWFGPIIYEYYAASEGIGFTAIGPEEWRARPGSVGKSLTAKLHITGDDGEELPAHTIGTVYFEGPRHLEYHNDPEKTAQAHDHRGWSTVGDLGWVDDDGYLYLSDRRTNLIISGGVNIYPQEIEDVLVMHPAVTDVAVIGLPDPEMGQQVKAVVQAADPAAAGAALESELLAFCRDRLAGFKCPRSVDFVDELPRLPTGKLAKRLLIDQYAAGPGAGQP